MQSEYLLAIYHNTYYNHATILTLKALPIIYCQYRLVICMHACDQKHFHTLHNRGVPTYFREGVLKWKADSSAGGLGGPAPQTLTMI